MTTARRAGTSSSERPSSRLPKPVRQALAFILIIVIIVILWEGLKWFAGDPWRPDNNPFGISHKPMWKLKIASDLNLPHVWTIIEAFGKPSRRNGPPLFEILLAASFFTFREAFMGFLIGGVLGFVLGTIFAHIRFAERGCMPYVVASQTVPILAIAPMVIIWLKAGWVSVAVISAYLTFFPVTINTLRGLKSPPRSAVDLMHSYAASKWAIMWKLRFPSALPYIFVALKISATASVVGAIIGELPSGIRDGLGGAILNFNQYYISGPQRLWATIIASAFVGIFFFVLIALLEKIVLSGRYPETELM
ncbi:MAG: ABC transporter permease [Chloroflexi bacterium]|nr:ABC transporter permease [Chloroflexota bacterium]